MIIFFNDFRAISFLNIDAMILIKKSKNTDKRDAYDFEHKGTDTFTRIIHFFSSYILKS